MRGKLGKRIIFTGIPEAKNHMWYAAINVKICRLFKFV